jgi:hypothetical protein
MRYPDQFSPIEAFDYARADLPDFFILTNCKLSKLFFKEDSIIFVILRVSDKPQEIWLICNHGTPALLTLGVFVGF